MQNHGAALGEAGEDDSCRIDAAVALRLDQRHDLQGRGFQLCAIDRPRRAHGQDVVPTGHGVAAVDGHRPGRRLGHDKAGAVQYVLQGFGHRQKIVTVGAQAV